MDEIDPVWVWIAAGVAALVLAVLLGLLVWILIVVRKTRAVNRQVLKEVQELHFSILDGLEEMPERLVQALKDLERKMNQRDGRRQFARAPVAPAHMMPDEERDPLAELARLIGQAGPFAHERHQPGEDSDDWPPRQ